jgi:hypothetical protein
MYNYTTACIDKASSRDEIIEAIVATKYPTYGAELAAINGTTTELQEHRDYVTLAKALADEYLGV